jgi:hypothetical protein
MVRLRSIAVLNRRESVCSSLSFLSRTFAAALFAALTLLGARPAHAQQPISLVNGVPTTQDFDSLGTSGVATLPSGWRITRLTTARLVGPWTGGGTTTEVAGGPSLSGTAAAGMYNFSNGTTTLGTDRAPGFLSSSTGTKSGNLYAQIRNDTGSNLVALQVTYNIEKYRGGTNAAGYRVQLYYSLDGIAWTAVTPATTFGPVFPADASNAGFSPAPGSTSAQGGQFALSLPTSTIAYLAWNYSVATGTTTSNAQALAIDDVSILGIPGAPVVSSINRSGNPSMNAASVDYGVTFDQAVDNVDASDFALVTSGVTGASITDVQGFGRFWTVTVATGSGDGTIGLNVVDDDSITSTSSGTPLGGAGTANGNFTGQIYTIDHTPPTLVSITRASANPSSAMFPNSVNYNIAFSEPVNSPSFNDFSLVSTGAITNLQFFSSLTGGPTTWSISVTSTGADGTVGLDFVNNSSITDGAGNVLSGPATLTGPLYTMDRPPHVVSIVRGAASPTSATSIPFVVTFDQPVTGVDVADFAVATTGTSSGTSVTSVVPSSSSVYTVNVLTGLTDGTIRLDLIDNDSILDGSAQPLASQFSTNGSFNSGEVYTVDTFAPSVQSSTRVNPSPTNSASVDFTVTFSEAVAGVDAADFAATASGITGASVTNVVAVNASVYTVSVNTGSGDGTLRLDVLADGSIHDLDGNALAAAFSTGQSYTIAKTPPSVVSIARVGASPTNAQPVHFTVTFSASVTGVDATDFAVTAAGIGGASVGAISGSGTTYDVAVGYSAPGSGTIRLDLTDDDSIVSATSLPLGGAGSGNGNFTTGAVYTIDGVAPSVQSMTRDTASPTNATSVSWTVTFSENVSGVDAADFTVATGGDATVSNVTGSGTTYTVTINTGTAASDNLLLHLADNDSIVDAAGNPLGGTGSGNGDAVTSQPIAIDKTAPTVTSITRVDADPTAAGVVHFTVTYSEPVSGVSAQDWSLTTSGITGASVTGFTGSGPTYTVTVNSGSGDGTIRLDVVTGGTVIDFANNFLAAGFTSGESYTIAKSAPSVSSIVRAGASPTNASTVHFTVTFSANVTGVDANDFALTTSGVTGASVSNVSGSGTTYDITATFTATDNGTVRLDLADDDSIVSATNVALGGAGATNGNFTTGEVYAIDPIVPAVTSIARDSASPTNGSSISWTVTFSESVSGVDAADFTVTTSGDAAISGVTGSGTTYVVTVNSGTASTDTIGLQLVDDDTIVDVVGNPLGGAGTGNGNATASGTYVIDRAAPTVASITRADADSTAAATVHAIVTFNESVSGVDASDFTLTTGGAVTGASITNVATSNNIDYTVTIATGSGDGTIRVDVVDDDTIGDGVGNKLGGAGNGNGNFTTGETYTIVHPPPPATHFSVTAPASVTAGATFSVTVTALDAANANVPSYTGTVHFTSSSAGTLPADYAFVAGDSGAHTFSVTLTSSGARTITAADGGITGSANITVNASAPPGTQLTMTAPATANAGTPFNVTVNAVDASQNAVTAYAGTVHFTSSGSATLPADYTFVPADNGSHTFSVTFASLGSQTVTVTDAGNATLTATATMSIKATTSTTLISASNPSIAGQSVTFTASVASTTSGTIGGSVTFMDGLVNLGAVVLTADHASVSPTLSAGKHTITAFFGGNGNYLGSASNNLIQIVQGVVVKSDLTGDGKSDIVLQNTNTAAIAAWLMDGTTITVGRVIANPLPDWHVMTTGDLDGDGKADIVLKNSTTRAIAEWKMDGTTLVAGATIATPPIDWTVVTAFDLTGDNRSDLILQNAAGSIAQWEMNGATIVSGKIIATPAADWKVIAAANFGSPGLVLQNASSGAVARWLVSNGTITNGVTVATPLPAWKLKAAGDFSGDGLAELVLQNDSTNAVAVWTLSPAGALTLGHVIATPTAAWKVSGIADFDGDGRQEIVMRNATDNTIAIWKTDGVTLLSGTIVATPVAGWKPIVN